MKRHPSLLWIAAIVLGWTFDLLFWNQSFGANFALFTVLCLAAGLLLLWSSACRPAPASLWLVPMILFFAAVTFVRAEPMTDFLGVVFALFLLGLLAITFQSGRWLTYGLGDHAGGWLKLLGSMLVQPIEFQLELRREQAESGVAVKKTNPWPILRGVVIAVPVLAVFAALLASADTIFSRELNDLLKLFFDLNKLPEYTFRLCYILVIAYALAGIFLHAAQKSREESLSADRPRPASQFLGFTETAIVLGSVIILFGAFVIIQFRYFFGGQAYLAALGMTDSEYARRGFGELAAVAFLSLLMILGLSTITRRETPPQRRAYSILSSILVGLVMLILVSAYQRLTLNELAHGFFRLRTYSHVFYVWLAALLVAVVVLEILHRERLFALAALIAALGFAASLSALNVDAFTARQSILRAEQGKYLNVADLASLSSDAVPPLVEAFLAPSPAPALHQAIGAVLVCHNAREDTSGQAAGDWRSFSLSRALAQADVQKIAAELKAYAVLRYPSLRVRTPANALYDCY